MRENGAMKTREPQLYRLVMIYSNRENVALQVLGNGAVLRASKCNRARQYVEFHPVYGALSEIVESLMRVVPPGGSTWLPQLIQSK